MKILLVTPKNPPSFWTYDGILPTLGKDCIFPNLSMPTVAGLTDRKHEVVLCDENVESIDFDAEADEGKKLTFTKVEQAPIVVELPVATDSEQMES